MYDQDDAEADSIWDAIDARMDSKRKERREAKEQEEIKKMRKNKPKIQSLFAPYKQELKNITYEGTGVFYSLFFLTFLTFLEWEALSEPGNHARTKKAKIERFTPAPKSLLEQGIILLICTHFRFSFVFYLCANVYSSCGKQH